jgi:hypothetical protein
VVRLSLREAGARAGIDVAAVNLGRTRADGELTLKLHADCGETLEEIARGETLLNWAAYRS